MKLDKNGAVINMVTSVGASMLGDNYIVMWDEDGIPIHIHKNVMSYLCNSLYGAQGSASNTVDVEPVTVSDTETLFFK